MSNEPKTQPFFAGGALVGSMMGISLFFLLSLPISGLEGLGQTLAFVGAGIASLIVGYLITWAACALGSNAARKTKSGVTEDKLSGNFLLGGIAGGVIPALVLSFMVFFIFKPVLGVGPEEVALLRTIAIVAASLMPFTAFVGGIIGIKITPKETRPRYQLLKDSEKTVVMSGTSVLTPGRSPHQAPAATAKGGDVDRSLERVATKPVVRPVVTKLGAAAASAGLWSKPDPSNDGRHALQGDGQTPTVQ